MRKSSERIVRPLTVKYAVALSMLAALAVANFLILRVALRESAQLAEIVNQASRQRMLLHQTVIDAERFVFSFNRSARTQARRQLLTDVNALEQIHHEQMSPLSDAETAVSENIRSVYEDSPWLLDSEMRNYLIHIRALADTNEDELTYENAHFAYIRNPQTIDTIRNGLEALIDVYENQNDAKTRQLNLLAIWSLVSTLVLLLLNGWFVFRPMVKQVHRDFTTLDALNETLEERVAQRTAEAEERADRLSASEAALRESQTLYYSLVHHLPMSVLRKDRTGRFTFANNRFCELMELTPDEIAGRTDEDLYAPELARKYRADDLRVMETEAEFQDLEEHRTKDGRKLFVEVLKVPLRDASDRIIGTQTMFWDVTDRKLAEEQAMQAERLAAIGQMVTGVAHESRNALQQIQACSQLLKWGTEGDPEKQELISDLQQAEERLLQMFEELRGYAAPMNLDRKLCDLREIIQRAWLSIKPQRQGRHVSLSEHGTVDVCTRLMADPMKLEQVFRNLLENAVAACDDPVRIEVGFAKDEGDRLRISVSDNGPGLSAEQQARLFEPFFTTKTQGTGLGMAIVKRIVHAHRGHISAASGMEGAVMTVTLPRGQLPDETTHMVHSREVGTT